MFGEASVLNDGRLVVAPWKDNGIIIGGKLYDGPQLRFPDAAADTMGRVWVVGKNQADHGPGAFVFLESVRLWLDVTGVVFGSRMILRAVGEGCQIAFTTSATRWSCLDVSPTGIMSMSSNGAIPTGEGAHGMRDWSPNGEPRPMAPVQQRLQGYQVRSAVSNGPVTIACSDGGLPGQVVMAKGDRIGTLHMDEIFYLSPRISANAQYWCGINYSKAAIISTTLPLDVPPLEKVDPHPPVIVPLAKPTSVALFFDMGRYGNDVTAPCDWSIVVDTGVLPPKPFIIPHYADITHADMIAEHRSRWNRVAGIFLTTENGALAPQCTAAINRQRELHLPLKPIYSYTQNRVDLGLEVPSVTYVGVTCYLIGNETPVDGERRWMGDFHKVIAAGRLPWMIGQVYNAENSTLKYLLTRYPEMCRALNVEMVMGLFSWGRTGDARDRGLGPWISSIMSATTPMVVPQGEGTMAIKTTIKSYQTPVRLGDPEGALAVAEVTTPTKPTHLQWQYEDPPGSDHWANANTPPNPIADLDHHYHLPHVGRFPIRVQSLVKVGNTYTVVDTSSSSSRVIEVLPTVPVPGPEPEPTPPPVPGPGEVVVHLTTTNSESPIVGADAWSQLNPSLIRKTDANGYVVIPVGTGLTSGVCVKKDGFHSPGEPQNAQTCVPTAPARYPIEMVLQRIPPPPPPVPSIHGAGRIFRDAQNTPWRYKCVTGFKIGNIFENGGDIRPFLDAYPGWNTVRVMAYMDDHPGAPGWPRPSSVNAVEDLIHHVAEVSGKLIEYCFLSNDSLEMSNWAIDFAHQLGDRHLPMFGEIRNEPETHSQSVSTKRCKPAFDASGIVYASGNYEHNENAFGLYGVFHSARDSEWVRKGHDGMEYFDGGGPHNKTDVARKYPWVADEPAKWEDVAKFYKDGKVNPDDWRAYFGTCALLCAGATFHSETGKAGLLPTDLEKTLAAAALEGLDAFPADAPNESYARPNDSSLRTYTKGNRWMVRCRPTTASPSGGWTRIGNSSILWRK